ncbi:peptide chain release factor N(5)-glutamine methyltransferase [bacterium]|nr:peptide chain release factor N(5)-glutamine methyltransferase [bacterium]
MKKIEEILKNGNIEEYKAEAKLIILSTTKLPMEKIVLDEVIEDNIFQKATKIAEDRVKTKKPIQQLLGESYFMGNAFKVNENTLIPRDETEFLVLKTIEKIKTIKKEKVHILDVGTGSGIIPISIALNTKNVEILGVDISTSALTVAIENAQKYLPSNIVLFRKSDLFENIKETFDIIVSNPPYIPIKEKNSLQEEVMFDPELALFAPDDDGVYFYKKIIENSKPHLKENGFVLFELGIGQSELVKKIMEENGFKNIEIVKDLAEIDRVIIGQI